MPVNCDICAALARSECVCEGAPRMVLAPRPPVSNVWPRDLFPEGLDHSRGSVPALYLTEGGHNARP